jgi:very-short-patch-repair endonuclease
MEHPFIGSEALGRRTLSPYQLRTHYRAIFPNVYLPVGVVPNLRQRTVAAWLWSQRAGVIAGLAAAALHGSKWIDDATTVELCWPNARPPRGIRTYATRALTDECRPVDGMLVTSPARTAFDLGRLVSGVDAVARLDALGNATDLSRGAIEAVAARHPGARNIRRLHVALDLFDAGAQSPKETQLRLSLIRGGFPRPQTQIPVVRPDGYRYYYLDMGWPEVMIAVEYDGGHHFAEPAQVRKDIERLEELAAIGWTVIRVVAGMRPAEVLQRVRQAWARRDCGGCEIPAG